MRFTTRLLLVAAASMLASGCTAGGSHDQATASATRDEAVRIVSQNLLHGMACPAASDRCQLPARVELFTRQLAEGGCPDIVGLQETNPATTRALRSRLAGICGGHYRLVTDDDPSLDREVVLTTGTVIGSRRVHLAGPLRTAYFVRVATRVGLVDFITTHLASSSDDRPCDTATCPPPCHASDSLKTCQAREVVALAKEVAVPAAVTVIGGDLNATVDEAVNTVLRQAGFVDSHLAAGNRECTPASGDQCTSGRIDNDLSDLTDPRSRQTERIDFVYVDGSSRCTVGAPTGLFNAAAAPVADGPQGLVFASDHTGVDATLVCQTSAAERAAATVATMPPAATTTTAVTGPVDAPITAAITEAFTNLFSGAVTDVEVKLGSLEGGEALRTTFLQSYEATKAVAARISVRIDGITLADADHADVIYTLLLEGTPVLDHLPGAAVLIDGRWLVSTRTYCDVSTQGATEIPPPCR